MAKAIKQENFIPSPEPYSTEEKAQRIKIYGWLRSQKIINGKVVKVLNTQTDETVLSINVQGNVFLAGRLGKLTSLPYKFGIIKGGFDCSDNQLTNLDNAPEQVMRTFNCSENPILSLKGAPEYVGDTLNCSGTLIENFEGVSKTIKNWLLAYNVNLIELKGIHTGILGGVGCSRQDGVKIPGAENFYVSDNILSVKPREMLALVEKISLTRYIDIKSEETKKTFKL